MKKKKKQQTIPPVESPAPAPVEETFTLEDILQEFGAPPAAQEEPSSPSPAPLDPALQTPIPRHHTRDADPETQRYQPSVEDFPERHIPNSISVDNSDSIFDDFPEDWEEDSFFVPGPDILGAKPGIPDAPAGSPISHPQVPRPAAPAAPKPEPPVEQRTNPLSAPFFRRETPKEEPPRSRKQPPEPSSQGKPESPPEPPEKPVPPKPKAPRPKQNRPKRPAPPADPGTPEQPLPPEPPEPLPQPERPARPPQQERRPKGARPRRSPPPAEEQPPFSPEPEPADTRPGPLPFPEEPRPKAPPRQKRPPRPVTKPIVTPEAQFRQAQQKQKSQSIRLVACLLVTLCNLALGFFHAQGLLEQRVSPSLPIIGEILLMLLSAGIAYDVLAEGLLRLLKPGFGFHTLVTISLLLSLADGCYALRAQRCTYCPLVSLLLTCSLWGLQLRSAGIRDAMAPARHCNGESALVREPNLYQKHTGVLRGRGSMTEFLETNGKTAAPQLLLDTYSVAVFLISAVIAGLTCGGDIPTLFQYWTAMLLAGTPILGTIIWFRPWAILNRRLQEQNAALYGWVGACRLRGKLVVPISDQDLFPRDNIKLNGVKYFGGQVPDRVVAYGSAVIEAAGSGLAPLFQEQMEIRAARRYALTKFRRYESGGAGGEIGTDSVLVGSLQFMQSMGVEMPAGTRVSQAVYVAINGTLAGVFAIHYGVTRSAAQSLGSLAASRGVLPVVTAGDFIISEPFLRSKFRVSTAKVKLPSLSVRSELAKRESSPEAKPCVLLQAYRFPAMAQAVAGARALCTAVQWGTAVNLAGGIMGILIMAILANLTAPGIMSPVNLGLFQLIWAVPGLLLSGWPRNV